jgi:hypothetical protein
MLIYEGLVQLLRINVAAGFTVKNFGAVGG